MVPQRIVLLRSQNETKERTKILLKRQSSKAVCMEGVCDASGVRTTIHKSRALKTVISIQDAVKMTRAVLALIIGRKQSRGQSKNECHGLCRVL